MANTLSFASIAKERAKITHLKLLIGQMMELVKRSSHFIVDHLSQGRLRMYATCGAPLFNLIFLNP
jgi:hypothetical protein